MPAPLPEMSQPRLVGIDLDVVLLIHHYGTEGAEHRAGRIDGIAGLAHGKPDRRAGLEQLLGGLEIEVPVPAVDQVGIAVGVVRKYLGNVDAAVLLIEVDAGAARLDLAADGGGEAEPFPVGLGQIFSDRTDRAGLGDQGIDHIVDRLEHVAVDLYLPGAVRHDVVAGARLRFGACGQDVLVALRRDVVDCHLDLVVIAPLVAQPGQRIVGTGDPMIPHPESELAGRMGMADIGGGNHRGGGKRRGPQEASPRQG